MNIVKKLLRPTKPTKTPLNPVPFLGALAELRLKEPEASKVIERQLKTLIRLQKQAQTKEAEHELSMKTALFLENATVAFQAVQCSNSLASKSASAVFTFFSLLGRDSYYLNRGLYAWRATDTLWLAAREHTQLVLSVESFAEQFDGKADYDTPYRFGVAVATLCQVCDNSGIPNRLSDLEGDTFHETIRNYKETFSLFDF